MKESSAMNELVSIVIPVYNVKDYVEQCLSSVLAQTYKNIEVIVVLDAPTDGSDEICRRFAAMDERIKLISFEKNKGVLYARSSGVKAASGKYLGFIDADDYIDPDMYQQLMECKGDFDLVSTCWKREEENKTRVRRDPLAVGPYRTEEDMEFILEHILGLVEPGGGEYLKPGIAAFIWNKLFRTSLAREVYEKMTENMATHDDLVFLWLYIIKCKSILITDICTYHYRIRNTSTVHSANINHCTVDTRSMYRSLEPAFMAHPRCDILMPQLQKKVATILYRAPRKMGFCREAQNLTFVFPFFNLLNDKHIALYGADEIGQTYLRQIRRHNMCEVDMWVDRKWEYHRREGWDVSPAETLLEGTYDYVVIAAERQDAAEEIRRDLLSMGIAEDKLLWRAPVEIS